jgi:hypothetical protein
MRAFDPDRVPLTDDGSSASSRLAARRRDDEFRRALNLAATLPASKVVVIEATGTERTATILAALSRLMAVEPRALNWGLRDGRIVISKGELPRRNRRSPAR